MDSLYLVGLAVLALFALVLAIILFNFFGLWIRARIANAPVSLGKMVGMRLRKVPVGFIVDNRITAVKAGLPIASDPLEAHYLAGGDVNQVVRALIAAEKANLNLICQHIAACSKQYISPEKFIGAQKLNINSLLQSRVMLLNLVAKCRVIQKESKIREQIK